MRERGLHTQYARAGEAHGHAKLTESDVALLRLIAHERALPKGWIAAFADLKGMSRAAVCQAIGGQSWTFMRDPKPVPSFQRYILRGGNRTRPYCPTCNHAKHYPWSYGKRCRDKFHTIDHRQFTSPINAKRAQAVMKARRAAGQ